MSGAPGGEVLGRDGEIAPPDPGGGGSVLPQGGPDRVHQEPAHRDPARLRRQNQGGIVLLNQARSKQVLPQLPMTHRTSKVS